MARNEASGSRGEETVVIDTGGNRSSCGYCKSDRDTSFTHGLWAKSLTVGDYQDLLDRGWRRSGSYLYKFEMERTCCPAYTIRLKAVGFAPSKEQLRVSKKMQRYLYGTLEKPMGFLNDSNTPKDPCCSACDEASTSAASEILEVKHEAKLEIEQILNKLSDEIDNVVQSFITSGEFPGDIQLPKSSVKKVLPGKKVLVEESDMLLYTCNVAFQVAAAIQRAQSTQKDVQDTGIASQCSPKYVAEKLEKSLTQIIWTSGLSIRACNGHINLYSTNKEASVDHGAQKVPIPKEIIPKKYKHKGYLKERVENPSIGIHSFVIHLKRSSFDPEEFALYKKYQVNVHNDKPHSVTESSYKRFLVDTPLIFVPPTNDGTVPPCGFGSFHQQYVIDGKLVAVGVIDILPKCLSSKYLFWDPDYAFLSLGKYSALQEIEWVTKNQVHCPSLQYYYLGYYIHSCIKMRYKAAYRPSELLCPLRYKWVPFDISKTLLDRKRYAVLSDSPILQNGELSAAPLVSEDLVEIQHDLLEDSNDFFLGDHDDKEMIEPDPDLESSDDESVPETIAPFETEQCDISNISLGFGKSRYRYKDMSHAFGQHATKSMESQLHRYLRVVGSDLAERMVYSVR